MDIGHIIVYAIVPIIIVMATGFTAGKLGVFSQMDGMKFNKVVMKFALPSAMFLSIVSASRDYLFHSYRLIIISVIAVMGSFMIAYFIYRYEFRKNNMGEAAMAALIIGSPAVCHLGYAVLIPIFGNTPYVGLVVAIVGIVMNAIGIPVALYLYNLWKEKQPTGSTTASLKAINGPSMGMDMNMTMPMGKMEGTMKGEMSMPMKMDMGSKKKGAWQAAWEALSEPVAWAPILAIVWVIIGIPWPDWASPAFDLIAKANASLAVFAVGILLSAVKFTIDWQVIIGSVMKLIIMPGAMLLLGILFRMNPNHLLVLVIAGALPSCFSAIMVAEQCDSYIQEGTSLLTLTVILFMGMCPLWIYITKLCTANFLI